ncbi:hypothetical protein D3C84_152760 [compost metagenome]
MLWGLVADAILVVHLGFVLFGLLGGLLVLWKRGILLLQLPTAAWAIFVELTGRGCPLTGWEQQLRLRAGEAGYSVGFVEHYLLPLLYPDWLTLPVQYVLAAFVLLVNLAVYGWVWRRRRQQR